MKQIFSLLFFFFACSNQEASIKLNDDTEEPDQQTNTISNVPQTKNNRNLVWNDEFHSDFDLNRWEIMLGDGSQYGIPGWGNNEQQYYQSNNITIEDSVLVITAKRESAGGKMFTSARIRTLKKGDWTYGWFEARIKLPDSQQGIWPAFWMLPSKDGSVWPNDGEIDIMEWIARDPNNIYGTIHYDDNGYQSSGKSYSTGQSFAETWHVYAVEWTADKLTWYIDDEAFHTINRSSLGSWPFNQSFHILLNLAVGGNWPGFTDETTQLPQKYKVDYVRVYQ